MMLTLLALLVPAHAQDRLQGGEWEETCPVRDPLAGEPVEPAEDEVVIVARRGNRHPGGRVILANCPGYRIRSVKIARLRHNGKAREVFNPRAVVKMPGESDSYYLLNFVLPKLKRDAGAPDSTTCNYRVTIRIARRSGDIDIAQDFDGCNSFVLSIEPAVD
jgi:hypothetical protein